MRGGTWCVRQSHGQLVYETPQLVVPPGVHRTKPQPSQVRMLLTQQGSHRLHIDLDVADAAMPSSVRVTRRSTMRSAHSSRRTSC